jgi:hypothetical protein
MLRRCQTTLEESEVSEEPIATIEHSALVRAHFQFSAIIVAATLLLPFDLAFAQDTSFGQRLFQDKADCQFCHGIDGDGRGDPRSPGAAADTAVADEIGGIPYDIKGTEFGHVGDRCSFDAIVRIFDIKDPALDRVATVVRGADTSRRDLAPECEGLYAISSGLSANFPDDHEMLSHGLVIYDALYTWCRKALTAAAEQPLKAQA